MKEYHFSLHNVKLFDCYLFKNSDAVTFSPRRFFMQFLLHKVYNVKEISTIAHTLKKMCHDLDIKLELRRKLVRGFCLTDCAMTSTFKTFSEYYKLNAGALQAPEFSCDEYLLEKMSIVNIKGYLTVSKTDRAIATISSIDLVKQAGVL